MALAPTVSTPIGVHRVLDPVPVTSLAEHLETGGVDALTAARRLTGDEIIALVEASGLRGRGGAGFPTGTKWRAALDRASDIATTSVIVNAAEGEPGSFKDRAIIRVNPYRVIEGALIAAHALGALDITIALKASFTSEIDRLRAAIDDYEDAGLLDGIVVRVFEGPSEYLYGEETGLLEAIAGEPPLPRVAPPYRAGAFDVDPRDGAERPDPARRTMAAEGVSGSAPPALINNVETFANIGGIVAHGPEWFRELGTEDSPGTIVATVTGATERHGVAEFAMGTTIRDVIDTVGRGARPGRTVVAAMNGVANAMVPAAAFDTPLTHEALAEIGSGLGTAGFIVLDDADDLVAVTAGVARFLAVESCGQCEPCKQDGLAIADILARLVESDAERDDVERLETLATTVSNEARCNLAHQQEAVTRGLLGTGAGALVDRLAAAEPTEPYLVAPILDIVDGEAVLDDTCADKNPDWTHGPDDSGKTPVDRLRTPSGEVAL